MKCGTYIEWKMVGRKKPVQRVHRAFTPYHVEVQGLRNAFEVLKDMKVCDGDVYPVVELENDGGCSCCSSEYIRVIFRCDKCNSIHQEFPTDEHSHNQFVKELMDGRKAEDIRAELLQVAKKRQKLWEEQIKKQRELTAKSVATRKKNKLIKEQK